MKLSSKCSKAIAVSCALIVATASMSAMPLENIIEANAVESYNYAKGLQYSMYLYDANMCGTGVDENSAMDWRDDCHTVDATAKAPNGTTVDVSGGYHDAGDHVKFGLPQAYASSILGWGYYEFKDAYTQTGQADHMKTISTYFADYFKNCTVMENGKVTAFCYQVGDGTADHAEWCSPESQNINRPTYWATSSNPATDIVSNTVGALAFHYKNFGDTESLTYAKALYEFAKNNSKQVASEGVGSFYASDSYIDDLMWAAAALYTVTGDTSYVTDANQFLNDTGDAYKFCSDWPLCWGNMWPLVNLIFGQLDSGFTNNQHLDWGTLNSQMMEQVEKTMTSFQSKTTLDGTYVCFDNWGSARYNTAMQLVGLAYDKINGTNKYGDWAKSQMDYLMGNNNANLCYITGFSDNSVTNPHHRAASGLSEFPEENTTITMGNTLIGGLVGGPKKDNTFKDQISQYEYTEVAIDYNAGFVGAMAGLYLKYGSGQAVDSSIKGVNGVSSGATTEATTTTVSEVTTTSSAVVSSVTTSVTTTTTASSGNTGNDILNKTELEQNSDGTDVLKIYMNTGNSDTVTLTLTGGKPGATTSGLIGYWDINSSSWVENSPWEEKKFDNNGNLTIEGLKVPTNTKDVQILLTYYADWSSGSENKLDKSSLGVSVTDGSSSSVVTTTAQNVTTTVATSTSSSSGNTGNNLVNNTDLEKNSDGTDVLKIHINTGNSDTVTLTLTGGKPGATTSGLVGYWDGNSNSWVENSPWEEKKFDNNGNLTIEGLKVPTNTKDVQILLTYYADWSSGSENLLDKSSLGVSVTDGSSSSVVTTTQGNVTSTNAPTTTVATSTSSSGNTGNNIISSSDVEQNSDGTDVLKLHINTGNSDTVTLTLTGGKPGATTSGLVGYWDNNSQSWVENSPWEEKKFDNNGNLTIEGLKVPTNTKDVQILLTYYADWSSGSENLLDKSSLTATVSDGSNSNATVTTTTVQTAPPINVTTTTTTTSTSSNQSVTGSKWGDVDCNGDVNSVDVLALKKYLLQMTTAEQIGSQGMANADVTHDNEVTSPDLVKLKKFVLTMISESELAVAGA